MIISERYASIVEDQAAFDAACRTPLPTAGWVNPTRWHRMNFLRPPVEKQLEPIGWADGAFRVRNPSDPAFVTARMCGGFHIQEEAAMLPVRMLDVHGDERVLDTCAAPGNKAAAAAVRLGPGGTVTAVDIDKGRLGVLRTAANVLGLVNVRGILTDARGLPDSLGPFDAALVDVPCSCEGTAHRHADVVECIGDEARAGLVRRQEALLRRAIRLVRPGGRVVYATCTYAPEENEGVVSAVLRNPDPGHEIRIVPAPVDGLESRPGLRSWRDRTYPDDLSFALRLWPHFTDTGGFFSVLFRKIGSEPARPRPDHRHAETPPPGGEAGGRPSSFRPLDPDALPWIAYAVPRRRLDGLGARRTGSKYASILSEGTARTPGLPEKTHFEGIRGLNLKSGDVRLSTAAAQEFGSSARRGFVEIAPRHVKGYLRRTGVPFVKYVPPAAPVPVLVVRCGGFALGLGRIDRKDPERLHSLYPKVQAGIEVGSTAVGIET